MNINQAVQRHLDIDAKIRALTTEKKALKDRFTASSDPSERQKIWAELQALIYEQVPTMKTGDVYTYNIASPKLKGLGKQTLIWPSFWNVSK